MWATLLESYSEPESRKPRRRLRLAVLPVTRLFLPTRTVTRTTEALE